MRCSWLGFRYDKRVSSGKCSAVRSSLVKQDEEAVKLYRWIMPVLHLDVELKLVQHIKLANQMTGLGSEWVRSPRLPITGEERQHIESIVQAVIDSRPRLNSI